MWYHISDWNAVYDNAPNIPRGADWPAAWVEPAATFRTDQAAKGLLEAGLSYGPGARQIFDLFHPATQPKGLVVFVHGGFWMGLDKSYWSHLAAGPLAQGYAVAIPSYTLAPEARIHAMTQEIGAAITAAAAKIAGPLRLVGHSAGGHLVTRMVCEDTPLAPELRDRIAAVLSISGLHDLRPMRNIWRNATLAIDAAEAVSESPALQVPLAGTRLTAWAGAMETSEFLRQNALIANIWAGLGVATRAVVEPNRHHFNVIDGLALPDHPLVAALLDLPA
ncbi:alpha/beta hydrolase fold domain-containing protein [Pseudomonas sp. GX19020]|uniref:alpha/beta hydrolase n=1 Tax=Pseudomonas sp. GX19020 TaxID=2942277 RepID=UPI002018F79A|nr:alpha/beta fold hydrolase [Pseudomonas sp. GX19020]MCL4067467.1 alpha/beta hydrolase fold domain-containing protein [Pseudomonas sp. GX19020]